jgi:hypothetical protein
LVKIESAVSSGYLGVAEVQIVDRNGFGLSLSPQGIWRPVLIIYLMCLCSVSGKNGGITSIVVFIVLSFSP